MYAALCRKDDLLQMSREEGHYPPSMYMFRVWFWVPVSVVLLPSTALHIKLFLTIRSLQKKGHCKSLFFRLFMIHSVLELFLIYLYLAGQLIVKDQPQGGDFLLSTNGGFFAKFYYYGTVYFFFHVQVWGVVVQSFNRFVAVCAPASKVRRWLDATPDPVWCIINTALPFAFMSRQLFQDDTCFIINGEGNVAVWSPNYVIQSNALQSVIVSAIGSVLSALCYALVLRKLLIHRKMMSSYQSKVPEYRREKLFTIVGFALFVSLFATMCYFIVIMLSAHTNGDLILTVRNIYILPVMLMTFVNPYMLTITDRTLRERMFGAKFTQPVLAMKAIS